MLIAPVQRRTRLVIDDFDPGAGRDRLTLRVPTNANFGSRVVGLRLTVEQSPDGVRWWPVGGCETGDWAASLATRTRGGILIPAVWLRLDEGMLRGDVYRDQKYADWGGAVHEIRDSDDRETYYAMALCRRVRFTVEPTEPISFGLDVEAGNRPKPKAPIGRRSASLVGVFTAAETGGTNTVTTGSRTSTAGTLITGTGSMWDSVSGGTVAISDNKSNGYTEPIELQFSAGAGSFPNINLAYNMAGTRGTTHTVTNTITSVASQSLAVGAQEWDGIESPPTVVSNSGTGTGTAVNGSPGAVSAASLVITVGGYDGSATTFAPNGSTSAQEIDENNDRQSLFVYYSVAQTGTPSVNATLAASRAYGWISVAFTEAAAPPSLVPRQILSPVFLAM